VGIPGTLGGAINGNAGAFGHSISDCIEKVEVLDVSKGKIEKRKLEKRIVSLATEPVFLKIILN